MLDSKFYLWLLGLGLFSSMVVLVLSQIESFTSSTPLSIFSICFFSLLCFVVHYLGKRAARSANKHLLTQLIMVVVFVKLLFCLFLVVVYDRSYQPETHHFVIPFLFFYVTYTVFEVTILTKANRLSN